MMLFLILLLLPITLHGMSSFGYSDLEEKCRENSKQITKRLQQQDKQSQIKKVKEGLRKIGCLYTFDFHEQSPLPKELVLSDFWKERQTKSEQEKNEAIHNIVTIAGKTFDTYYLIRPHIVAAVIIGAPIGLERGSFLSFKYKDEELAKAIIQNSGEKKIENFGNVIAGNKEAIGWLTIIRQKLESENEQRLYI